MKEMCLKDLLPNLAFKIEDDCYHFMVLYLTVEQSST